MRRLGDQQTGDVSTKQLRQNMEQLLKVATSGLDLVGLAANLAPSARSKQFLLLAHAFKTAKSEGKNVPAERLHDVLQDLYKLQVARTMLTGAKRLAKRLKGSA